MNPMFDVPLNDDSDHDFVMIDEYDLDLDLVLPDLSSPPTEPGSHDTRGHTGPKPTPKKGERIKVVEDLSQSIMIPPQATQQVIIPPQQISMNIHPKMIVFEKEDEEDDGFVIVN